MLDLSSVVDGHEVLSALSHITEMKDKASPKITQRSEQHACTSD